MWSGSCPWYSLRCSGRSAATVGSPANPPAPLADRRPQLPELRRADRDLVAWREPDARVARRPDPRGGAGRHDVAGLEGHQLGQVRYELRHREDQVIRGGGLHRLAVEVREKEIGPSTSASSAVTSAGP